MDNPETLATFGTQDEDTTTQIYMTRTSLSSSGTGISIIGGGVKLVVCVQINLQE